MLDKLISIVRGEGIRSVAVTPIAPAQNPENTQICDHCGETFSKPSNLGFPTWYMRDFEGFICYGCNERREKMCAESKDVGEYVDRLIREEQLYCVYFDSGWECYDNGYEIYYGDDEMDYFGFVCEKKVQEWLVEKRIFQCKQCGGYFTNHLASGDSEKHCSKCVHDSAKRTMEFNRDDRCDICGKSLDSMHHHKFGEQGEYSNKEMCTECYVAMQYGKHIQGYSMCNKCNLFEEGCIVEERFVGICDKAQYMIDWQLQAEEDAQNIDYLVDTAV